jgi:hypothetical protein
LLNALDISLPSQARCLTKAERGIADPVYGGSLDYADIFVSDGIGLSKRPFTTAIPISSTRWVVILNLGSDAFKFGAEKKDLIHELAHAWQSQHHPIPWKYMYNCVQSQVAATAATALYEMGSSRAGQIVGAITSTTSLTAGAAMLGPASAYAYVPGMSFGEYGGEQIAQQVEDYHYPPAGLIQSATVRAQMEKIWRHIQLIPPGVHDTENIQSLSKTRYAHKSYPNVVWHIDW